MLVYQGGWHKYMELRAPENIRLIDQPSSSPELNSDEHFGDITV